MDATFGTAEPRDADDLARIDSSSRRGWSQGIFLAELERRPPTVFVLRRGDHVVAFAVTRTVEGELDIVNLAVSQSARRQGLGELLLGRLVERARAEGTKSVFLEVRAGNEPALALYAKSGFQETQRRRNFYTDPVEDAILMRLEIAPERG
jgi:ribosomal-protein-alanine acetyltransferase